MITKSGASPLFLYPFLELYKTLNLIFCSLLATKVWMFVFHLFWQNVPSNRFSLRPLPGQLQQCISHNASAITTWHWLNVNLPHWTLRHFGLIQLIQQHLETSTSWEDSYKFAFSFLEPRHSHNKINRYGQSYNFSVSVNTLHLRRLRPFKWIAKYTIKKQKQLIFNSSQQFISQFNLHENTSLYCQW